MDICIYVSVKKFRIYSKLLFESYITSGITLNAHEHKSEVLDSDKMIIVTKHVSLRFIATFVKII